MTEEIKFKPLDLNSKFPYKYAPQWTGKTLREMIESAEIDIDYPNYPGSKIYFNGLQILRMAILKYNLNVLPEVEEYLEKVNTEISYKQAKRKEEFRKQNDLVDTFCRKTFSPEGDIFWDRSHF